MPLDIGVGIVLAILTADWFGTPVTPILTLLGILCALAPDIDMLPIFWRTSYDHRSYPHYPIVQAMFTGVVYLLLGPLFATLYGLGVFAHLVHDTVGLGWGVAWLWPLSKRKFLFLPVARMKTYGWFMSWLPEEEGNITEHDTGEHWIRHYYLRPHPVAFVEYGILLIALALLLTVLE